jgi:FkbM family methyltransferase
MSIKNNLNKFLRKFNVELHGLGYLQSLAKGEFKKDESDIFKTLFGNQDILIYDVGANRGVTIDHFIQLFPGATVHGFEPYKELAEGMSKRYVDNKNIIINKCGIADMQTTMSLNINFSADTSSLLLSKKTGLNSDKQVETVRQENVPVITIDEYAAANKHDHIHILKLDIQGSELNALKGAENLLTKNAIDAIFTEAYFIQQYEKQPLFHEIVSFLFTFDYELQDIYHPLYGKGKLAWCDALFVKKNLKLV